MRTRIAPVLLAGLLILPAAIARADAPMAKPKIADPEAVFKKIDTNGDGKLSKEEFRVFIIKASSGKLKDKPELIDKLFDHLDVDGNGYLSLDEFKKLKDLREKLAERKKSKQNNDTVGPNR